jgi:hypothetical protein
MIGAIVAMMILAGGVSFLAHVYSINPDVADEDDLKTFNNTFNKLDDVNTYSNNLASAMNTSPEQGTFGFINSLINIAWNTVKNIFTSFTFTAEFFGAFLSYPIFGIPSWVVTSIISIITIIIAFAIIKAIFGSS